MELALINEEYFQSTELSTSLSDVFSEYAHELEGIRRIAEFIRGKDELINYFTSGNTAQSFMCKEIFREDGAIAALNAAYWNRVIKMTKVVEYMPAEKRNEWFNMIHERKTPHFDRETVLATVASLLNGRGAFFADKVDGVFRKLSGRHVTNSPMAFKERMIMDYVLDRYGFINHQQAEYLQDLRTVIAQIRGLDSPTHWLLGSSLHTIVREKQFGKWFDFDGGAFRVKIYKVGTAHVEIHPTIAQKLNRILASKYPQVIPADKRAQKKTYKERPLYKNTLSYNALEIIADLSRKHPSDNRAYLSFSGASNNTKEEVLKALGYLGGVWEKGCISFPEWPSVGLSAIVRTGLVPDIKSHQYYPTKETLARRMVDMAEIDDSSLVLEPSAGQGGIAKYLPKDQTTCVEIEKLNAEILESKGFKVCHMDFLKFDGKFDRIVMNPPFSDNRAKDHVRHAFDCLNPEGILVACLPASLKGKILVNGTSHEWSEVLEDHFDGTSVRVALLRLYR